MPSEMLDKKVIKALNVDTRREIVKMLSRRPYTASELAKITNKHVTTITQHLNTLEDSGLIHKKESVNKWKYYELSDKGEKLFKTQYYTWVVVLGLSALAFVGGLYKLYTPNVFQGGTSQETMQQMPQKALDTVPATIQTVPVATIDLFAILLIGLSVIGFTLAVWKIKRIRNIFYG